MAAQAQLPVFDLSTYDSPDSDARQAFCQAVAECLARTGCLIVKDGRVSASVNEEFLDTLEAYFGQAETDKTADVRAHLSYQVGYTPEGVERPRLLNDQAMQAEVSSLPSEHAARMPTGADVKCRFFWRVGSRPSSTDYPELNAEPVIPKAFPHWSDIMDGFGNRLLSVAQTVAECVAEGLGLPRDSLTQVMHQGPHLLAPTGSDLQRHGQLGTVLAGYHSDLNMLTVHGKSRFPGLHIWLADGTRFAVAVPPGCLLVQAGQQLEWLTGGHIKAGRHEVVVTEATQAAVAAAQREGRTCWRASSTVFVHAASDVVLQPLGRFASETQAHMYPPTPAGLQVHRELAAIALQAPSRTQPATTEPLTTAPAAHQSARAPTSDTQVVVDVSLTATEPSSQQKAMLDTTSAGQASSSVC